MLCTQPYDVAVSGSYAYVAALDSDSLVVIDISNPASPAIRGSVASSSLLDNVREAGSCTRGWPRAPHLHPRRPSCLHPRRRRLLMLSRALSRSRACFHLLCTQALGVAVSGSFAYVTGYGSHSLVVIDVSNPASPVIRGSVVLSSLMLHARGVAVSGSYAYVTGCYSDSLVVVVVSNPLSPVIRGSVVSSSLMDEVRVTLS